MALYVGAARFELTTSWSQTRRDTGLRYAPKILFTTLRSLSRFFSGLRPENSIHYTAEFIPLFCGTTPRKFYSLHCGVYPAFLRDYAPKILFTTLRSLSRFFAGLRPENSIQHTLKYPLHFNEVRRYKNISNHQDFFCDPSWNRTSNLLLRRQLLYPIEL